MLYVYITLISLGVNLSVFGAIIVLLRVAVRPYIYALKAMSVTVRPWPLEGSTVVPSSESLQNPNTTGKPFL